jgi:MinD-like ATPase involved in chromosome partitioning or flagellar assembly
VTVVPGGRGPGRPDPGKQARERAAIPLDGPRLVVVLGCTVGAGQTVTTLVLADLLAALRGEPVAALDLNPGPTSLTKQAHLPATTVTAFTGPRAPGGPPAHAAQRAAGRGARVPRPRLDIICDDPAASAGGVRPGRLLDLLASRYTLTLADPGASAVARVLPAADQLILVAPASPDAPNAIGMTLEWLSAHGHGALSASAILLLNGVSQRSTPHAEQAEQVVSGRCRAIVRVPWDDHLAEPQNERGIRESLEDTGGAPSELGRLRPAVLQAYTALAGVLVSALAASPRRGRVAR